jgi:hypothetical protein
MGRTQCFCLCPAFVSSIPGGWGVLRNWNRNTFDYHNVLKKLHATYRVEPFFSIRVVPDDKHRGANIIKVYSCATTSNPFFIPSQKF